MQRSIPDGRPCFRREDGNARPPGSRLNPADRVGEMQTAAFPFAAGQGPAAGPNPPRRTRGRHAIPPSGQKTHKSLALRYPKTSPDLATQAESGGVSYRMPGILLWVFELPPPGPGQASGDGTAPPQPQPNGSFRRGRIDHPAALHDLDPPGRHQPPRRLARVFHAIPPTFGENRAGRLAWADRRTAGPIREQFDDRFFQPPVRRRRFATAARIGAVPHLLPTTLPLLPPLDSAAAGGAGLVGMGHGTR
jgi:hypothetical protein